MDRFPGKRLFQADFFRSTLTSLQNESTKQSPVTESRKQQMEQEIKRRRLEEWLGKFDQIVQLVPPLILRQRVKIGIGLGASPQRLLHLLTVQFYCSDTLGLREEQEEQGRGERMICKTLIEQLDLFPTCSLTKCFVFVFMQRQQSGGLLVPKLLLDPLKCATLKCLFELHLYEHIDQTHEQGQIEQQKEEESDKIWYQLDFSLIGIA